MPKDRNVGGRFRPRVNGLGRSAQLEQPAGDAEFE
jgi:hypothetical protein